MLFLQYVKVMAGINKTYQQLIKQDVRFFREPTGNGATTSLR
ncbi:MAG: hypothetical protein WKF59_14380 [Chitinophagaceae bacterium]